MLVRPAAIRIVSRGRGRTASGFTLIEIMAVVVIIGLTMAFVMPNLAANRSSRLRDQSLDLATRIELARERAILTGKVHFIPGE